MPKFVVRYAVPVFFAVTVEDAEDREDAISQALDYASLSSYMGNGGRDKLIGTSESCVSLEPGEGVLEGDGWSIEAEQEG